MCFRILRPDRARSAARDAPGPEFDPERERAVLAGQRIAILRAREEAAELARALERAGARVECIPAIETRPLLARREIDAALAPLPRGAFVLVASPRAAAMLPAAPFAAGRLRAGALGPGTAAALARAGIPVDLLAETGTGAGLAEAFAGAGRGAAPGAVVAVAQARGGRPDCREALLAAGYEVRELLLYEARPLAVEDRGWDAALVASPSAAEALPRAGLRAKLVAIGETTRAALEARGLPVAAVAARPTTGGMAAALAAALGAR
jgi:uroporphyrinogen-III synthase